MSNWWWMSIYNSVQFSSVQSLSRVRLCNPMNCSTPGLSVHHQLPEFSQTHVHWVGDAIQPSHPLSSPSPPAPNPSQHQSFPMSQLFVWGGQSIRVSALASVLPKNAQDFRMDRLDLLAAQGPLKRLPQHHMWHVCVQLLSHVQLSVTPWTVAHQAPLSMGFSRREYGSGLPFPSPGHLPNPGTKPVSHASPALAGGFLTTASAGKPQLTVTVKIMFWKFLPHFQIPKFMTLYSDHLLPLLSFLHSKLIVLSSIRWEEKVMLNWNSALQDVMQTLLAVGALPESLLLLHWAPAQHPGNSTCISLHLSL